MNLSSDISDLHNKPSSTVCTPGFDNVLQNHLFETTSKPLSDKTCLYRHCSESLNISNHNDNPVHHRDDLIEPTYNKMHLHRRCHSSMNISNFQNHTATPLNFDISDNRTTRHAIKSSSIKQNHTRHFSWDIQLNNNTLLNNSLRDKNISLNNISGVKTISSLNFDHMNELNNLNNIDPSTPMDIDSNTNITLTDNALLCLKTLVSPISIFLHIGRFAFTSASTTFSFTTSFVISDLLFFSFLDKFNLSYLRYVLLGITGIVAAFSIKGIVSSTINLILSIIKGTYSWYFSLINPECSFTDFFLGVNEITVDKS